MAQTTNRSSVGLEVVWGTLREPPAASLIAGKLYPGSSVLRFKAYSTVDWAVVRENEIVAALEIKVRRFGKDDWPSTILPTEKYNAGRYTRRFFDFPTFAVILFTDALATIDLGFTPDDIKDVTRRGEQPVSHAFYLNSRLEFHDDLFPLVQAEVARIVAAANKE